MEAKPPPYCEDSERGVLGSVIMDPERVLMVAAENGLSEESFFIRTHRDLYQGMVQMRDRGRMIDPLTVASDLKINSTLLEQLIDAVPTSAHAEHYITKVRELHQKRLIMENARDAIERVLDGEEDAMDISSSVQASLIQDISRVEAQPTNSEVIDRVVESYRKAQDGDKRYHPSFLPALNETLLGWRYGKLYIVAARPGGGKSTFAPNDAKWQSMHRGVPTAIMALEMDIDEMWGRIACEDADLSTFHMEDGKSSPAEFLKLKLARDRLKNIPLTIYDRGSHIEDVIAKITGLVLKKGVRIAYVDHIQKLRSRKKFDSRNYELEYCLERLRRCAKELDISIVAMCMLKRDATNSVRPQLKDLKDSGAIEQDAYGVVMLWYCGESDDWWALVDKNRGGPVGDVRIHFNRNRQRFEDPRAPKPNQQQEMLA